MMAVHAGKYSSCIRKIGGFGHAAVLLFGIEKSPLCGQARNCLVWKDEFPYKKYDEQCSDHSGDEHQKGALLLTHDRH